ncbi:MAG: glucose-6-phosphate isomerase [Halioglobus sp.]
MLAEDESRAQDFTLSAAGLRFDFSKQLLDRDTLTLLQRLAEEADLTGAKSRLLRGEHVNVTEDRPALHTLLRADQANGLEDAFSAVMATRERMQTISIEVNSGARSGFTGAAFTDVVSIGIGGSDLGPRLVSEALGPYQGKLRSHYVANVDPADLCNCLQNLDPATTLFVICSKSFTTEETLANGLAAREWMLAGGAAVTDLSRHFLAVTTNLEAAANFGIDAANCLPMWDWVGGRYSVWSAVGLGCAIGLGWDNFSELLAGARAMDQHFAGTDLAQNLPAVMALLEVWNSNCLQANSHVVLPYNQSLRQLPDYLQQLTMESNGKRVDAGGNALDYASAPVLWGSAGTLGQHSFHQLLHQGTRVCSVDFVLPLTTHTDLHDQHRKLVAHCLAQSRTMMVGRSAEESKASLLKRGKSEAEAERLATHLVMPGNRPNSVISMDKLSPETLGALLALYEHRTFCSAQLWGINPFDQWGVELGKEIGADVLQQLGGDQSAKSDPATAALVAEWQAAQQRTKT